MNFIKYVDFSSMISSINRKPDDIGHVKSELENTFQKQIANMCVFDEISEVQPDKKDIHLFDEIEVEVLGDNGFEDAIYWRRKPENTISNSLEVFKQFKFLLENIGNRDVVLDFFSETTPLSKIIPPADTIITDWLQEKELYFKHSPSVLNALTTLESFFVKDSEKCIQFIDKELKSHNKAQGKLIALIIIGFAQTGYLKSLHGSLLKFRDALDTRFPGLIGSYQAISKYTNPYYNPESKGGNSLTKVEIEEIVNKIKNI